MSICMPRFFLHLRSRVGLIEDIEGSEHTDFEAARAEALASARELLAAQIKTNQLDDSVQLEVYDECGSELAQIPLWNFLNIPK